MAEPFIYAFEWDPVRATANLAAHGVAFEMAVTLFRDPFMLSVYDTEHSEQEERWASVGRSEDGKLLVVIHTFEEAGATGATVRLISAREATRRERQSYEETPR